MPDKTTGNVNMKPWILISFAEDDATKVISQIGSVADIYSILHRI